MPYYISQILVLGMTKHKEPKVSWLYGSHEHYLTLNLYILEVFKCYRYWYMTDGGHVSFWINWKLAICKVIGKSLCDNLWTLKVRNMSWAKKILWRSLIMAYNFEFYLCKKFFTYHIYEQYCFVKGSIRQESCDQTII